MENNNMYEINRQVVRNTVYIYLRNQWDIVSEDTTHMLSKSMARKLTVLSYKARKSKAQNTTRGHSIQRVVYKYVGNMYRK